MTARLDDTNTHTFFLREPESLDAVIRNVPRTGGLVWSAGCSTGEEVYSLAMLARESGVELRITGSDINRAALEAARRGHYPERRIRYVDSLRRAAVFETAGGGTHVVKDDLRSSVRFVRHDLAVDAPLHDDDSPSVRCWDAILCRNVFLYLTDDQIDFALAGFARSLKPGGIVFFGASEVMSSVLHSHRPRRHGLILTELDGAWGYQRRDPKSPTLPVPKPQRPPPPRPRVSRPGRRRNAPQPAQARHDTPSQASDTPNQASADLLCALRMQGDRFLDAGDPRGALEIFQSAVERDDLQADLHLRIAMCQLQAGAPRNAREALRRALFLEPDLWPAAMLLGDLLEPEDPRLAEMYFRQALDAVSAGREPEVDLCGALAPFVAGRRAAAEALECRLRLLQEAESPYRAAGGGL